ncbi:IclR family transcriptional regulator [Roseomonas sp. 18066]|uniref:IclR family transcriptional regulator n=1 Tax=Roseomonas sp. 18066 TaxID=2681412 RepID=UPI001358269C|nr:IclR family transcriptional regulator [Roseomonas sp. 18066]
MKVSTAKPAADIPPGVDDRLFLQGVQRTMQVLEAFARQPRPLSLAELAAAAGVDKSATQRIAHTLQALGYLERQPSGLAPGKKLLDRGFDFLRAEPLIERAVPVLHDLRKSIPERVDLSLFDDTSVIYVVRLQSKRETFSATLVGRRIPTFCSSGGRAILAALPEEEAEAVLARSDRTALTPATITDLPGIRAKLAETRRDGFSLCLEESLRGEITLGAAVRDASGRPVAAIHVAASLAEWKPAAFRRLAPLVLHAAEALSRQR